MQNILQDRWLKKALPFIIILAFVGWSYLVYQWFQGINLIPSGINIGPIHIRLYSVSILIGAIAAYIYALYRARSGGISSTVVDDFLLLGIPTGLIGTRLAYVFQNWHYFKIDLIRILYIWEGGLTLHGGLMGGVILLLVYTRVRKLSPLKIGDAFAPTLFIAEGIGRWGNFFNQELIGYPTNSFIKMFVSPVYRPWGYENYSYFHPVFLYQSVVNIAFLIVLLYFEKKKLFKEGEVLVGFFFLHSLGRFLVEFLRIEPRIFAGLSLAQLVSVGIMVIAVLVILVLRKLKGFKCSSSE